MESLSYFKKLATTLGLLALAMVSPYACTTDSDDPVTDDDDDDDWISYERFVLRVTPDGVGWLEEQDGEMVMHISGSAYERGFQHGYLAAPWIETVLVGWNYGGEPNWELGIEDLPEEVLAVYLSLKSGIPEQYLEEAEGLYDGLVAADPDTPVELEDIIYANLKPDFQIWGCRQIGLWGPATSDGRTIHGRSLGYTISSLEEATQIALQDVSILVAAEPEDGHSYGCVSWPGVIGCVDGMNDQGITISMNDGFTDDQNWNGIARPLRHRMVLEGASTLDQASEIISSSSTIGWVSLLADGKETDSDHAVMAMEQTGELFYSGWWDDTCEDDGNGFFPREGVLMRFTSEYKSQGAQQHNTNSGGHPREEEIVDDVYGSATVDTMKQLLQELADPAASVLHWVVYEPDDRRLWVARAVGSYGATNFDAAEYSLPELLDREPSFGLSAFEPPSLTVTSPTSGTEVTGEVVVSGTAHSAGGLTEVRVKLDDQPYQLAEGAESWTWTVDTTGWKGKHRVRVLAVDAQNQGALQVMVLPAPNSPPELETALQDQTAIMGQQSGLLLCWWDPDADLIVDGCLYGEGAGQLDCNEVEGIEYQADDRHKGHGKFGWIPTAGQVGEHLITFVAQDDQGNSGSVAITIEVVG